MNTIGRQFKDLKTQKEQFALWTWLIKNFWLSNKKMVKKLLNQDSQIPTYVTLCPFYDREKWWINWEYSSFWEVDYKYQKKLKSSLLALEFLKKYYPLKVEFLLADRWVMLSWKYNIDNFDSDILWIRDLYFQEISRVLNNVNITTFTDFWIDIEQTCNVDEEIDISEIYKVLIDYWVDVEKFKFSLEIIIQSFWKTWAYYLILNYLEENKQLCEIFEDIIFLNTEVTSSLNSLYRVSKNKIDAKNIFARVDINS